VKAEGVEDQRIAEGVARDRRSFGNLRVGDLAALVRLAGDRGPQLSDAEAFGRSLLRVEGACLIRLER